MIDTQMVQEAVRQLDDLVGTIAEYAVAMFPNDWRAWKRNEVEDTGHHGKEFLNFPAIPFSQCVRRLNRTNSI